MFLVLSLSAFVTAIISGVIGMGGGILLLSIMTFFLSPTIIIPIHGFVQLVSNASRVGYLLEHVKKNFFWCFLLGLPFGTVLSVYLLKDFISDLHIYLALLVMISYSVFKPKKLPQIKLKPKSWIMVGFISGVLAILIGAVGPLLAVFFIRDDFTKEEIVSTKSAMQLSAHFVKIPAFLFLEFNYLDHVWLIIAMSVSVILGTKVGVTLLKRVDSKRFKLLFKGVLLIAGIRIAIRVSELV